MSDVAGTRAMRTNRHVGVFGAYGHTARFVLAELCARGWTPVLAGRDADRLAAVGAAFPELEARRASVDDAASLDAALRGTVAAINCAGPFLDTAAPVVAAALRAGIHYLDLSAEQATTLHTFERHDAAARAAGVVVMPAMAFYGGLADLMATAALGDWPGADDIDIAVALDSWHPTTGTRRTGARNRAPRVVVDNGSLAPLADPPPTRAWTFDAPFGEQAMVALPMSEIVLLSRHVRATRVHSHMNLAPLVDLRDPHTPTPVPADARGRSAQQFMMEAAVTRNGDTRVAHVHGRDIYAVTAPLVVAALERLCSATNTVTGARTPGEVFPASELLASLPDLHFRVDATSRNTMP